MAAASGSNDVFVDCPFDREYEKMFHGLIFAIFDCGFRPRCALELGDASEIRLDKIYRIIGECWFGLHDISRTKLDSRNKLPRFNMPFELGLFLAAKKFGGTKHRGKVCLVLEQDRYRYQKFISDIAGQDIKAHENKPKKAIMAVRDWLRDASGRANIPGGIEIFKRNLRFQRALPALCSELRLEKDMLTFNDFANLVSVWLEKVAPKGSAV